MRTFKIYSLSSFQICTCKLYSISFSKTTPCAVRQNSFKIAGCNVLLTQSRTILGSLVAILLTKTNKNSWEWQCDEGGFAGFSLSFSTKASRSDMPSLVFLFQTWQIHKTLLCGKIPWPDKDFLYWVQSVYTCWVIMFHKSPCMAGKE